MENTNKADLVMAADGREDLRRLAEAANNEVIRSHGWAGTVEGFDAMRIDEAFLLATSPARIIALLDELAMVRRQFDGAHADRMALSSVPGAVAGLVAPSVAPDLPPLPPEELLCGDEAIGDDIWGHTADQMTAYARAALAQAAPASPASAPEASKPTQSVLDFLHHCAGAAGHDVDGTRLAQMARSALKSVAAPLHPVVARKDGAA